MYAIKLQSDTRLEMAVIDFQITDVTGKVWTAERVLRLSTEELATISRSTNPNSKWAPLVVAVNAEIRRRQWRVKDFADGWITYPDEDAARASPGARSGAAVAPVSLDYYELCRCGEYSHRGEAACVHCGAMKAWAE